MCARGEPLLGRGMHAQVYATSMAMLVTLLVSVAFFGLSPSLQLLLGILTASISLLLYYVPPGRLLEATPPPPRPSPQKLRSLASPRQVLPR